MKKIFILYALFLIIFAAFSYAFVDPNLIYLKNIFTNFAFTHRLATTILYVAGLCVFFSFYLFFLNQFRKKIYQHKEAKIIIAITTLILIFAYPAMLSYDIFNYIATAKVLFFYHENPYIIMPIAFSGDPLLLFMHAANKTALYGPTWILITGIPFLLSLGNFFLQVILFKLLVIIFFFGCIWMLWKLTKNIYVVMLFALNPLTLIEIMVSGHNDSVMIFLALFSLLLLQRKKIFLSIIFLLLSIFVKFATIFLLPVFIFVLWKVLNNKKINWEKIWLFSAGAMFIIFLLSPIRDEIYPWYATWFLPFVFIARQKGIIVWLTIALSGSLMLRYIPFMLLGTYFGPTPILKILFSLSIPSIVFLYFLVPLWLKKFYQ